MILNLRDLQDTTEANTMARNNWPALSSFVCHGHTFQSFRCQDYHDHEAGYQDRLQGLDPQEESVHYRQGYLEAILQAGGHLCPQYCVR